MKATERWFDFEAGDRVEVAFPHWGLEMVRGQQGTVVGDDDGMLLVSLDGWEERDGAVPFDATELLPARGGGG